MSRSATDRAIQGSLLEIADRWFKAFGLIKPNAIMPKAVLPYLPFGPKQIRMGIVLWSVGNNKCNMGPTRYAA